MHKCGCSQHRWRWIITEPSHQGGGCVVAACTSTPLHWLAASLAAIGWCWPQLATITPFQWLPLETLLTVTIASAATTQTGSDFCHLGSRYQCVGSFYFSSSIRGVGFSIVSKCHSSHHRVLNVKSLLGISAVSRGLLHDYENFAEGSFPAQALRQGWLKKQTATNR